MKKVISLVAALALAVTMCFATAISAYAVDSPTAPVVTEPTTSGDVHDNFTVNGDQSNDVTYTPGTGENEFVFDYVGDGTLTGWDNNFDDFGLIEGVDYEITYNDDGTMTITFISDKAIDLWNNNQLNINAVVEEEEAPSETTTSKKDDSSKSPNTGISTTAIAGTVAVLGAGVAVLAATKKKDAE